MADEMTLAECHEVLRSGGWFKVRGRDPLVLVRQLARLLEKRESPKYDDVLTPFLALMRRELHANAHKGDRPGWLKQTPAEAMAELHWHVAKLEYAQRREGPEKVAEYAADIANCCMMLLDVRGELATDVVPAAKKPDPRRAHGAGCPPGCDICQGRF